MLYCVCYFCCRYGGCFVDGVMYWVVYGGVVV